VGHLIVNVSHHVPSMTTSDLKDRHLLGHCDPGARHATQPGAGPWMPGPVQLGGVRRTRLFWGFSGRDTFNSRTLTVLRVHLGISAELSTEGGLGTAPNGGDDSKVHLGGA
jgi:hypothetical protein